MRDLAWLRDTLGHPIHWDTESRTYRWTSPTTGGPDTPQEVAGLWFKPSEVLALLTLQHLIKEVQPGDLLHRHLRPIEQRLNKILCKDAASEAAESRLNRVRIVELGRREVPPRCFESVGTALVDRRRLSFRYQARGTGEISERTVSPQRLIHYRSNWLLDAWCHVRDELRSFSLDQISDPRTRHSASGTAFSAARPCNGPRCASRPSVHAG